MSSDQVGSEHPSPKVEHWGSYDLRGAQIGDALVTEPVARDERGVVWEVICPCGAVQFRSTGQLTRARDVGAKPLCPKCLAERRAVLGYERRDRRVEHFYWLLNRINPLLLESQEKTRSALSVLLAYRGLYGPQYEVFEEDALRKEIYETLGAPSDVLAVAPASLPLWEGKDPAEGHSVGPDWSSLYPMVARRAHALLCHDCKTLAPRGWGCVRCIEFSCFQCVSGSRHLCRDAYGQDIGDVGDGLTLEAVGNALGAETITRERVRHLVLRGIRKLRAALKQRDGAAEAKCEAARYAILSRLPNPALEEAFWEERQRAEEEQKEKAREALRRFEARQRGEQAYRQQTAEAAQAASDEQMLQNMWWHIRRKVALGSLRGRDDMLPWDLRYPPSKHVFDIGDSVVFAKSPEGLVSCLRCRRIVLEGTPEFFAHSSGRCDFVVESPAPISIQGLYFPWDHDRPLLLSMPESGLHCFPLWTHVEDLRYVLERAMLSYSGVKRVTNAALLMADVPTNVTVIVDAWFTPEGRLRFTQLPKEPS